MDCSQNHICETEQKSGGDKRIQQKDLDLAQKYWADCIESRGSIAYSHLEQGAVSQTCGWLFEKASQKNASFFVVGSFS